MLNLLDITMKVSKRLFLVIMCSGAKKFVKSRLSYVYLRMVNTWIFNGQVDFILYTRILVNMAVILV